MTDPYRTPAEIAADIPRRPIDVAFWRTLIGGVKLGVIVMFVGGRIAESCAAPHVPPMHDVARYGGPVGVGSPVPRHVLGAFPPDTPLRIDTDPSTWSVYLPGETIALVCNGKPSATCNDTATIKHTWKTLDVGTQKSPDSR